MRYANKLLVQKIGQATCRESGIIEQTYYAFQLCWYEERQKQWPTVKGRVSENELLFLFDAITRAEDKFAANVT